MICAFRPFVAGRQCELHMANLCGQYIRWCIQLSLLHLADAIVERCMWPEIWDQACSPSCLARAKGWKVLPLDLVRFEDWGPLSHPPWPMLSKAYTSEARWACKTKFTMPGLSWLPECDPDIHADWTCLLLCACRTEHIMNALCCHLGQQRSLGLRETLWVSMSEPHKEFWPNVQGGHAHLITCEVCFSQTVRTLANLDNLSFSPQKISDIILTALWGQTLSYIARTDWSPAIWEPGCSEMLHANSDLHKSPSALLFFLCTEM